VYGRYDLAIGQFTQTDPIGIAGGLNTYGYAGGDPINFSDPFGLDPCDGIIDLDNLEEVTPSQISEYAECLRKKYEAQDEEEQQREERWARAKRCSGARAELVSRIGADIVLTASYAYGAGLMARGALTMSVGATEAGLLAGGTQAAGYGRLVVGSGMVLEGSTLAANAASTPGLSSIPTMNTISFVDGGGLSACSGF